MNGRGIDYGTDKTAYYTFKCASENESAGSVASESGASVKDGESVTVTATAKDGWKFECWSDGSTGNPYTKTISENTVLIAHFIPSSYTAPSDLVGYATITSDAGAKYMLTGGAGGETIEINSLADLTSNAAKLSGDVPYIVKFTSGTRITTNDNKSIICSIGSNKTIYGTVSGAGLKNIEMRVSGNNVIIRNLVLGEVIAYDTLAEYKGQGNDALALNGAKHVWVDHCELHSNLEPKDNLTGKTVTNSDDSKFDKDFYDGLLDLKNGASWVTISNCYLHDHWKAFLCGSGDDHDDGDSNMRLTIVNCYFKDINSRQPLFRWGKAHIFNNYFLSENSEISGKSNCIDVRINSQVLAEGNTFVNVKNAIGIDLANGNPSTMGTAAYSFKNNSVNGSNASTSGNSSYVPPYTYTVPTSAVSLPSVETTAGESGVGATLGTSLSY